MQRYKCRDCAFTFSDADRNWDFAIDSGRCPKCSEPLYDFPVPVRGHKAESAVPLPPPSTYKPTPNMESSPSVSAARFCSSCEAPVVPGSNFCGHCGKQQDVREATSLSPAHDIGDIFRVEIGTIRKRLKISPWDFLASENLEEKPINLFPEFPPGYGPSSPVDIVVTDNYFVVLKVPSLSATHKLAEDISINTMGLGLAGGALALGTAFVGEGYEKMFGNSNKLDDRSLATCFESGNMMFAKRKDIVCHAIQIKEGLLSPTTYRIAVAGMFFHVRHDSIDLAFYFEGNELIKVLEEAGWNISRSNTKFTSISLASQALAPKYLDSVQHHEKLAKWCAKCVHYRSTPDWITGRDKYGLLSGAINSKLRVANNKLPCKIPEQVSEVWDRYFSSPPYGRQKYATDCPRFARHVAKAEG
jgi:hypothetical protein